MRCAFLRPRVDAVLGLTSSPSPLSLLHHRMSIALSVVVHPSRLLRRMLRVYGMAQLALAAALWAGWAGPMAGGPAVALACLLAGLLVLGRACQNGTDQRIDLSGTGALRVTVQQKTGPPGAALAVRLEAGSTLWPWLLCLSLASEHGREMLLVAPDSMSPEQFRALRVALRSIARRDNVFFEKNKIV